MTKNIYFWAINIIIPRGDSNSGLGLSVYLNLTHALNRLATTSGFKVVYAESSLGGLVGRAVASHIQLRFPSSPTVDRILLESEEMFLNKKKA